MTLAKVIVVVGALVMASNRAAQLPAPTAPASPSTRAEDSLARSGQAVQASPDTAPAPPPNYTYSSEGRRDPFVPAVGRSFVASPNRSARPQGISGLLVAEIVVRGLLESQGAWVAMVGAPDGRSYTLRVGDHLMDGTVRTITSEAVVIMQQVNDPLSNAKQREVRKYLRGGEQVQ